MAAGGDAVTFADHDLSALVKLGRPTLLQLKRIAQRKLARAKGQLESIGAGEPLHRLVTAQAQVRRAAEAVVRYQDAIRLVELSSSTR